MLRALARRELLSVDGAPAVFARLVCWASFAAVVLRLVPVTLSTPDLLVVATQLAALAALLRAGEEAAFGRWAAVAGIALALGFLAKGAVLVVAVTYLVAIALLVPRARVRRITLIATAAFGTIAGAWIAILSARAGALTAGSVARLNLAWYVGGQSSQTPDPRAVGTDALPHQWGRVAGMPEIYDFRPHAVGTYPPWTDPTWWHEGLVPRPTVHHLRDVLVQGASLGWSVFGVALLVWLVLLAGGKSPVQPAASHLPAGLALLAAAQFCLYWPVHVDVRFLGIAWLYAWLAVMTWLGARPGRIRAPRICVLVITAAAVVVYALRPPAMATPRELAVAVAVTGALYLVLAARGWRGSLACLALMTAACAPWSANFAKRMASGPGPVHRRDLAIARALHEAGIADGAAVASVNATFPASWARMGRWHVEAEVAQSSAPRFWRLDEATRAPMLRALARGDVAAIVGVLGDGAPVPAGWIVAGKDAVILPASRIPR